MATADTTSTDAEMDSDEDEEKGEFEFDTPFFPADDMPATEGLVEAWETALSELGVDDRWEPGDRTINITIEDVREAGKVLDLPGGRSPLHEMVVNHTRPTLHAATAALRRLVGADYPTLRVVGDITSHKRVQDIRTADRKTLVSVSGRITNVSPVSSRVDVGAFHCRCGTLQYVQQPRTQSDTLSYPPKCRNADCGACSKRAFTPRLDKEQSSDFQRAILQDFHDVTAKEEPSDITVEFKGDLVDEVKRGNEVRLVAIVEPYEDETSRRDLLLEVIGIEPLEMDSESLELTEEDRERNRELAARDDTIEYLAGAIAPQLKGDEYDALREAVLLQAASMGDAFHDSDKRSQLHVGLVGDAGAGKTEILDDGKEIAAKAVAIDGEHSSAAGLVAGAERESRLGGADEWTVKPGAFVKANKGIAIMDEIDEADEDDINKLHTALESQSVNMSKMGNATLKCETALLCAANPDNGDWDPTRPAPAQLSFGKALISRIDLVYQVVDEGDNDEDIFRNSWREADAGRDYPLSLEEVKRYVAEANQRDRPSLPAELEDLYVGVCSSLRGTDQNDEDVLKSTLRIKDSVTRIAVASARLRLADEVAAEDLLRAKRLLDESMRQTSTDADGNIDKNVLETGVSTSQAERMETARETVEMLTEEGSEPASRSALLAALDDEGVTGEKAEHAIEKLLERDFIYEAADGGYRKA